MDARLGEFAGLFASFAWAIGSLVFSRVRAPAAALNLFKNSVATVLFLITLAVLHGSRGSGIPRPGGGTLGWLTLSAVVGIVVGDTAYFRSLQILGPRRALVLTTLSPTLAALLGTRILGETLSVRLWLGMAVTLLGVVWAVRESTPGAAQESTREFTGDLPPSEARSGSLAQGIGFGFLGALCQALGAVWSKLGMRDLDALEASSIRLAIAAGVGLLIAVGSGRIRAWCRVLLTPRVALPLGGASALGTYLGIWSSLLAFKHAPLAVATTLTTLSPIFVIPLARLFLGQRASPRAILGAVVAVSGVLVLFF